jgi:hypothetical protein
LKDLTREARVSNSTLCGQGAGRHGLQELAEQGLIARRDSGEWFRPDFPPPAATAEPTPGPRRRKNAPLDPEDVKRRVVELLGRQGPLSEEEIATALPGLASPTRLATLMEEDPRFQEEADGYHLSSVGFAELESQRSGR